MVGKYVQDEREKKKPRQRQAERGSTRPCIEGPLTGQTLTAQVSRSTGGQRRGPFPCWRPCSHSCCLLWLRVPTQQPSAKMAFPVFTQTQEPPGMSAQEGSGQQDPPQDAGPSQAGGICQPGFPSCPPFPSFSGSSQPLPHSSPSPVLTPQLLWQGWAVTRGAPSRGAGACSSTQL